MSRSRSTALTALALWLVAAAPDVARAGELAAFAGTWSRAETARDDARREAEITRVTEALSFVLRGFARSLMRRRMVPDAGFALVPDGEALRFTVGDELRAALQPDGATRTTEDGEITDRWLPDGRIERSWSRGGDEGHGTVIWSVSDDARLLSHEVTVFNPHYEGAMRYTTTYRRAGPQPRILKER